MPLQKVTLKEGNNETFPQPGQRVQCHYVLALESGEKIDSSRDRGKPFEFTIGKGEVIRGYDEGLRQMSVGERAQIKFSPDLGYGQKGIPGTIPANATLLSDVELLSVM